MKKAMTIVGFLAALMSIMGMIFKIMHWPGAGPLLILGFTQFAFFFVPVFGYRLFYEQSGKISKIAGFSGSISLSFITLGILFKMQHWPGSPVVMLFGWGMLCLITFPLLMVYKVRSSQTLKEKFLNIFWYCSLSLILLGYIFKILHLPGASMFLLSGTLFMCFGYLPIAYKIYNNDLFRNKLYSRFLLVTALLVQILLTAMSVSKDILDSFILVNDGINETGKYLGETNNAYYARFENFNRDKGTLYYQKAQKVKEISDDLFTHIEKLKAHLIRLCDRVPPEIPDDSLSLLKSGSKDNYDIPTHIMIGEPATPKTGAWTGIELKAKIAVFRQDIISMFEGEKKEIMKKTLGLRTDDFGINNSGDFETWETGYFYHLPLASVITILSKLQSDARYAESVTVEYLYNQAEKEFEKNVAVLSDTIYFESAEDKMKFQNRK